MLDLIFAKGAGKSCLTLRGRGIVSGYWKAAGMYSYFENDVLVLTDVDNAVCKDFVIDW